MIATFKLRRYLQLCSKLVFISFDGYKKMVTKSSSTEGDTPTPKNKMKVSRSGRNHRVCSKCRPQQRSNYIHPTYIYIFYLSAPILRIEPPTSISKNPNYSPPRKGGEMVLPLATKLLQAWLSLARLRLCPRQHLQEWLHLDFSMHKNPSTSLVQQKGSIPSSQSYPKFVATTAANT